jgi:TetR/AcrR family transcriptional regulator, regulator of cefoperazone and chloramphenicol sensitivity
LIKRKDGEKTRERLFDVACRVFGESGYRAATLAEICEGAGANIAAINYHFGSKEMLYREVCAYAVREISARYPLFPTHISNPEAGLRAFVETLLARGEDRGRWGFYHGLRMHEFRESSGVADDLWLPWFRQHFDALESVLKSLLPHSAPPEAVRRCELSIVGPCFMVNFLRTQARPHGRYPLDEAEMASLVDHIIAFSLAGLREAATGFGQEKKDDAWHLSCP